MILGYYLNNRLVKKIIFTLAILQISSINNSFFSKKNLYEQFDKIFQDVFPSDGSIYHTVLPS